MTSQVDRREFLRSLGVGAGAALGAAASSVPLIGMAQAQAPAPKGNIPSTPYKIGHMTFFTGPAALLGEPMYKGQMLAAEEINAQGGLLGKRKIEVLKADEAAGVDGNVKELRRLKLQEKIDFFCGITSSGNTPALGPVAEELKVLTMFIDGCTDFLFDKAVPNPHYIFRVTNIQSADGATSALAVAQTWPDIKRVAHIHPDYSYGRNAFDHFGIIMKKLLPKVETVSEGWPKLGTTDFSSHITKAISSKPDLLFTSVWGGDYVAMYKQALQYGLFDKMKVGTTLALGTVPHALGKDHPEGVIGGCHANYFFFPGRRPLAGQQELRREVSRALEGISELPGRGCVHRNVHAESGYRKGESPRRRRLAGRRRHHQPAGRHGLCRTGRLRLHPPGQPPGLQGHDHRLHQERARVPVPDHGSRSDHHHPDPQHHRTTGMAEGRADVDVHLDRQDLADGQGVGRGPTLLP
jgi:branched-chain amino acid transport system substrate-binding protein